MGTCNIKIEKEIISSYYLESQDLSQSLLKFLGDSLFMNAHKAGKCLVAMLVVLNWAVSF